jgi:hypothetical protein
MTYSERAIFVMMESTRKLNNLGKVPDLIGKYSPQSQKDRRCRVQNLPGTPSVHEFLQFKHLKSVQERKQV